MSHSILAVICTRQMPMREILIQPVLTSLLNHPEQTRQQVKSVCPQRTQLCPFLTKAGNAIGKTPLAGYSRLDVAAIEEPVRSHSAYLYAVTFSRKLPKMQL